MPVSLTPRPQPGDLITTEWNDRLASASEELYGIVGALSKRIAQLEKGVGGSGLPAQAPHLAVSAFGYVAGGWRVDQHPRLLADTTGDGRADIVGFHNRGTYVSRAQADGSFTAPQLVVDKFGFQDGWRVNQHPRMLADTTGDGRADIVGFGNDGTWVSRAQPDGTFTAPQMVVAAYGAGPGAGGWRVDVHPRFMADTTGDGRADIVGFGDQGAWVSRAKDDGTFTAPVLVVAAFGAVAGGWRMDTHPRFLADTTGDGRADIVGFGNDGVYVSRAQPDGTYTAPGQPVVANFTVNAGGWRVDQHPRVLADTTGDGRADIVGFGGAGVWVSRAQPDGTFTAVERVVNEFAENQGWRGDEHLRLAADTTGDGRADIVGFGNEGVFVSRAKTDGGYADPELVVRAFGHDAGDWRLDRHPRMLADTTGVGRADIVGFGDAGVYVSRAEASADVIL